MAAGQQGPAYNYAAAFVAYCKGQTLREISEAMAIPLDTLIVRHQGDRWPSLKLNLNREMALVSQVPDNKLEARLEILEENRRKNFEMFAKLRDDFSKQVDALLREELRMTKVFCQKGQIVTHEATPSSGDRVNLATYARTIAEGTYAALGDRVAGRGVGEGAHDANAPTPPAITIVLPGAIASPRESRQIEGSGPQRGLTIDMREKVPQIIDAQEVPQSLKAEKSA